MRETYVDVVLTILIVVAVLLILYSSNIVWECTPGVTERHRVGRRFEADLGHQLNKYMVEKTNVRLQRYLKQLSLLREDTRPMLWKRIHVSTLRLAA